jgi:membrane-associated phospholipid phosphatase
MLVLPILWDLPQGAELQFFNAWRGSFWDQIFIHGTKLGEEHAYVLLTLFFFWWRRRDFWWIPLTGFTVMVVSYLLKRLFNAPRPGAFADQSWYVDGLVLVEGIIPYSAHTSLPSGHTMSAFALAVFLVYLIPLRRIGWLPVFLMALLVGVSRMYLVLHFLRDVVLGSVIGILLGLSLAWAHRQWLDRSRL